MNTDPFGTLEPTSGRDRTTGRFLRGNTAALVTGERSRQFWQAAEGERHARRLALLRQRGFTSEQDAPAALVAVSDGAAQAILLRNMSFVRLLELGGPTTMRDRRRDVLKVWENAADRALRHLQAIGLERVAGDVPSLDAYLRAHYSGQDVPENATGHAQDSPNATVDAPDDDQAVPASARPENAHQSSEEA